MGFWSTLRFWEKRAAPIRSVQARLLSASNSPGNQNPIIAFTESPALYRVAHKIATSVARAQWQAYRVKGADRPTAPEVRRWTARLANQRDPLARRTALKRGLAEGQLELVPNHPLLDIIERGSDDFDATTTMYLIQLYLFLVGEVYVVKNYGTRTGQVREIQPFPPHALERNAGHVSDDVLTFRLGDQEWRIPRDQVFVIRRPNPKDPYTQALGAAQVLVNELDVDESAALATAARFRNGMRPDLLIQIKDVEEESRQRVERQLQGRHGGPMNHGKPLVTEADSIQVEQLSPNLVDMDIINLRNQQADTIRETPGIPPEIFGRVLNSNRSTIAAADYLYSLHVVEPELHFLMRAFNHHLARDAQDGVFLGYESPVPADREFQLQVMSDHPDAFVVNEKRALADLPERDDGELTRGSSFTAGQIQQVVSVVEAVAASLMSRESGASILVSMYGLSAENAEAMLGPEDFEATAPEPPEGNGGRQDPEDDAAGDAEEEVTDPPED